MQKEAGIRKAGIKVAGSWKAVNNWMESTRLQEAGRWLECSEQEGGLMGSGMNRASNWMEPTCAEGGRD